MSKLRIKEIDDLIGVLCRAPCIMRCGYRWSTEYRIKKKELFFIKDYRLEITKGLWHKAMITFDILVLKNNITYKFYCDVKLRDGNKSSIDYILPEHEKAIINQVHSTMIPFSKYVSGGAPKKQKVIGTKYQEIKNKSSD